MVYQAVIISNYGCMYYKVSSQFDYIFLKSVNISKNFVHILPIVILIFIDNACSEVI